MEIAWYLSLGLSGIGFAIIFGYLHWDKIKKFLSNHRFQIAFSLCAAILGFFIMNNQIGGKILGAALFFGIGWLVASVLMAGIKKINNKALAILLEVILVLLMIFFAITRSYVRYHRTEKYYDRYGNVHYTDDARDKANERYDIYDAADEYRENH